MAMDEHDFERRAADAWKLVLDLFDDVDPGDVDVEAAGDVIRIDCRGGRRIVLNTQRPARQIWLAGGTAALVVEPALRRGVVGEMKRRGRRAGSAVVVVASAAPIFWR